MSYETIPERIRSRYPVAFLRGPRITRLEEKCIGYFRLDADAAWELGSSNVGVFVGASQPLGGTTELLRELERIGGRPRWIIVAATKKMAAVMVQRWFGAGQADHVPITALRLPITHENVVLTTPESLSRIVDSDRSEVAGVVVIDMLCQIHRARGIRNRGFFVSNDRPQLITDFRNSIALDGWLPPFVLITQKAAKSVLTDSVARSYGLDAWWFVDGRSLRCGAPPVCQGNVAPNQLPQQHRGPVVEIDDLPDGSHECPE